MKKIVILILIGIGSVFIFSGCEEDVYIVRSDYTPPAVPKGVYSVTRDKAVWIYWEQNEENDLAGYRIYRKTDENSNKYYHHATVDGPPYIDYEVKNGKTYFYGMTAFDYDGNESGFSYIMFDTPRPEGFNWVMYDYFYKPSLSGFDFSEPEVLHWEDEYADIYLEYDDHLEVFFLWAANGQTDIQDFGYTDSLTDVDYSPSDGWSKVGWLEVIKGHTYIIWTWNDHFAKLRVRQIVGDIKIYFDWAYQEAPSNRELAPRPPHGENFLKVAAKQEDKAQKSRSN